MPSSFSLSESGFSVQSHFPSISNKPTYVIKASFPPLQPFFFLVTLSSNPPLSVSVDPKSLDKYVLKQLTSRQVKINSFSLGLSLERLAQTKLPYPFDFRQNQANFEDSLLQKNLGLTSYWSIRTAEARLELDESCVQPTHQERLIPLPQSTTEPSLSLLPSVIEAAQTSITETAEVIEQAKANAEAVRTFIDEGDALRREYSSREEKRSEELRLMVENLRTLNDSMRQVINRIIDREPEPFSLSQGTEPLRESDDEINEKMVEMNSEEERDLMVEAKASKDKFKKVSQIGTKTISRPCYYQCNRRSRSTRIKLLLGGWFATAIFFIAFRWWTNGYHNKLKQSI